MMRIAIFATLGLLPSSLLGQARGDVPWIPNVVGMTATAAIDTLRWTKLRIVQLDSITTSSRAGRVVRQRPAAGTALFGIRAETLFVAVAPRRQGRGTTWGNLLDAVGRALLDAQRPPRSQPGDPGPPDDVQPEVPPSGGESMPPGRVVQLPTTVPDLYRSTPNMVSAALERSRLNPGKVGSDYSDDVPRGRVFRQVPVAGEEVPTYTEVAVWYSIGPHPPAPTFSVPRVVGLELAEASDSLRRSGFRVGGVTFLSRRGAERKVVHQSPGEGEPAHRNDAVDLTITTPPPSVSVPSVIGLTRDAARQRLERVGLSVGQYTLVVLENRALGIVSQTPRAGAEADSGALVDLVENRQPEVRRVPVPNLSGKTVAASDSALRSVSLILGDVLRPGVNALDRVIDQRPRPGESVFMHSAVMIALGAEADPPPERMIRIPGVVNLTVDSARRMLSDSGFTRISIGSGRESLTSASIVESQTPAAGTFVTPGTLVSLVAQAPPPLPPMPNLVGQRRQVARIAAELDSLRMIVVSEARSFRLHDEVVRQYPAARQPRRPDKTVDVFVEIPFIPPLAAAILGIGVVGGVGGESVRRLRRRNRVKRPASGVTLKPITGEPAPPVLHAEGGGGSLIKASFTLHFGVESSPTTLEVEGDSLVKPEKESDA